MDSIYQQIASSKKLIVQESDYDKFKVNTFFGSSRMGWYQPISLIGINKRVLLKLSFCGQRTAN